MAWSRLGVDLDRWLTRQQWRSRWRWQRRRWPLAAGLVVAVAGLIVAQPSATTPARTSASTSARMPVAHPVFTPPDRNGSGAAAYRVSVGPFGPGRRDWPGTPGTPGRHVAGNGDHSGTVAGPATPSPPGTPSASVARPVPPTRPGTAAPPEASEPSRPSHSRSAGPPAASPSPAPSVSAEDDAPAAPSEDTAAPSEDDAPAAPNVPPGSAAAPVPSPYGADEVTTGWTERTRYLVDQVEARFPVRDCDGQAEGTTSGHVAGSDHYSGNAADCFAASVGAIAAGSDRDLGDAVAGWAVRNAAALKVKYVIWYGRIYDLQISDLGWHTYCNAELSESECANPTAGDVATNQHYDHVHISLLH